VALAVYASLALVCVASLVVGQAILVACGRRELTWLSGPVGLATILVASGIAIKLPGHATTVAIALASLVFLSLATLVPRWRGPGAGPENMRSRIASTVRGRDAERSPGAHPALAVAAAILAALAGSIPFIVNGRVGILGVGLVNDDMANHLLIADWLGSRVGQMPALIHQGYPVGPHALVAGLHEGVGVGLVAAFAGLTLALPALTALVAFEALDGLRRIPRVMASALVALPYLAAAYLAQEAFKEPIEALFVLSFALLLPAATGARRAIPLGVIAAGAVYAYSFPGLFWLAGTAVVYLGISALKGATLGAGAENMRSRIASTVRGRDAERSPGTHPAVPLAIGAVFLVLLVLTAPDLGRIVDFTNFRAFKSSTISGGLGNLRHQLSPLEALGIWPASDFRLSASDASGPAAAFYLGGLVAAAALACGLPRWIRHHGAAVPAALAAAIVIYIGARLFGTVYTSAKALAIAAPLVSLISFGGLLARDPAARDASSRTGTGLGGGGVVGGEPGNIRSRDARTVRSRDAKRSPGVHPPTLLRGGLALALAAGMALSSFLVLRQAPVGPTNHADQLAELRPLIRDQDVLFLGRDNFIAYELRGARVFTAVRNYYDPNYVKPNLRLKDVFRKFDFDSVTPHTLSRFPFVITTGAAYASGPPPSYRPVRQTPEFVLWRRTGPMGPRRTLAEGANPGAILACSTRAGHALTRRGGSATLFESPPAVGGRWSPSSTAEGGSPVTQTLRVPAGRWAISIQYDSTQPLVVSAPGMSATLPANLDYRGSVPYYPAGELTVPHGGPVGFTVTVERPPLAGRLLGTTSEAHLGAIAASPAGPGGPIPGEAERRVPLRRACGRYLDWYQRVPSGAKMPPLAP
jgi:hypothetical protein